MPAGDPYSRLGASAGVTAIEDDGSIVVRDEQVSFWPVRCAAKALLPVTMLGGTRQHKFWKPSVNPCNNLIFGILRLRGIH